MQSSPITPDKHHSALGIGVEVVIHCDAYQAVRIKSKIDRLIDLSLYKGMVLAVHHLSIKQHPLAEGIDKSWCIHLQAQ